MNGTCVGARGRETRPEGRRWSSPGWRGLAGCALGLLLAGPSGAALAQTIDCTVANAENIANGTAHPNGYTIHPNIHATTGALAIQNVTIPLPPNGIVCVAEITCQFASRTLWFARNAANTPVYLLVEGSVTLGTSCGIDVSGDNQATRFGLGMDRIGGLGGPGGSDGGSCDFTYTTPSRAGNGLGPGGGRGAVAHGGGGGASPIEDGGAGFGADGGAGGVKYSAFDHRLVHGGSGGGCGSTTATSGQQAGGGGGGVLVLGAGGPVNLSHGSSFFRARGGSGASHGGGGGGGVVRIIAPSISGNGSIRVDGTAGSTSCGTSTSLRGGCGGHGVIKFESPSVSGNFVNNSGPPQSIFYGVQQPIVPPTGERPVLTVESVTATWDGQVDTVTPVQADPAAHTHTSAGVFLEAPSPAQLITVTLSSNNAPSTATVWVKFNAVGSAPQTTTATTAGTGSGALTWTVQLSVPPEMELGSIEAWIENVCTPGSPGCP